MTQIRTGQINPTSEAWSSWAVTFANLTIGNATVVAKYIQIGKTVHFRLSVVIGSTTTIGSVPQFTLPVTAAAYGASVGEMPFGYAEYLDAGVASYMGTLVYASTTAATYSRYVVSGSSISKLGLSSTAPFTFGVGDEINATGTYEAA